MQQLKKNIIQEKSYDFAKKILLFCYDFQSEMREYVISKQLLRSGTSVGANIEEAIGGISKKDFRAKLSIAYKEARESKYWLRLIRDCKLQPNERIEPLLSDLEEILKMLYRVIQSSSE
ncbi:MAG: four helix bundle protein [Schleiferiaceae bacterium]|nr:four helix bundle protein [Schleiferiaceae bacterium]